MAAASGCIRVRRSILPSTRRLPAESPTGCNRNRTCDGIPSAADPAHPTEVPAGAYDIAVFENRFPTFSRSPGPQPAGVGVKVGAASGSAEVVVFTQDSTASLGSLPLDHLDLL